MEKNIINYYNHYEEDGRLFRNYSHQVEWLTTMYYFDRVLPPHSRIFDGCAGTGNYAFELARREMPSLRVILYRAMWISCGKSKCRSHCWTTFSSETFVK